MAELIDLKRADLKKALAALTEVLEMEYTDILRDSTLLRFELAAELAWKTIKILLRERFTIDSPYATTVYREALKVDILTDTEVTLALQMTKDRNRMVHDYNASYTNKLFKRIQSDYSTLLHTIYKNTA